MVLQTNAWSHSEHKHESLDGKVITKVVSNRNQQVYVEINNAYLKEVKALFKKSCFNCHSSEINYPWYYKVPGVKQLIDHDTREAKKHLDFSKDFPFLGHGKPLKDLQSISKQLTEGKMPPLRYAIMHRDESLTDVEVQIIQNWIKSSIEKLNNE